MRIGDDRNFTPIIVLDQQLSGCNQHPAAPDAPQINYPEQMDDADRRALADFYRRYAVYKDKVAAWKKRYK